MIDRERKVSASDLDRFVLAQASTFDTALRELRLGRKRTHWMWYVFPQLRGLGLSPTADYYGIASLAEARDYLAHPLLGRRLEECVDATLAIEGRSLHEIFGSPDDLKFRSCVTLFANASADRVNRFQHAVERLCSGVVDQRTLELLGGRSREDAV